MEVGEDAGADGRHSAGLAKNNLETRTIFCLKTSGDESHTASAARAATRTAAAASNSTLPTSKISLIFC